MHLSPRLVLCLALALVAPLLSRAAPPIIDLWPEGVPGLKPDAGPEREENGRFLNIHHPTLTVFAPPPGKANGTAVIYAPGGGYVRVAAGLNGGELTTWLNSLGVTVFMLKYRNAEYGHPAPLQDALRAVRMVRSRAAEFGVKPDRIGMLGGSAGGHLTACAGTLADAPEGRTGAALDPVNGRPDFMILVFPVISMQPPYGHAASIRALLGDNPSPELRHHLSVDAQVTAQTPPTFLVHSTEDRTVVVENSLLFFQAMRRANRPIEMHLYPKGPHGAGMDPKLGPTADWPKLCEAWMRFNGWLPSRN
ncbi:alpha/beta hydrolase [Opitutus sp. ER46]|uniref:alpha/beta hydrolase n=1 Tax=Opitutus sp. ER46 TaxID=2161864 RepID=UPI000D30D9F5|nr:alpha/beta hydrolase [Opitutus sp. ER46]PTX94300.1 alpha/beta hydrolase [Opitutus sp. ER46]